MRRATAGFVCAGLAIVLVVAIAVPSREQAVVSEPASLPPRGASATLEGVSASAGITVDGSGVVTAHVARARAFVRFFGTSNVANLATQPAGVPAAPGAGAADAVRGLEQAVIDALHGAGVPDARFLTPVMLSGNMADDEIVATIDRPSRAKISDLEDRVAAALVPAKLARLPNFTIQLSPHIDDCPAVVDRAARDAYADATKKAQNLASVAGVRLGGLVAATQTDSFGACETTTYLPFYNAGSEDFDTVPIRAQVRATFAIVRR